MKGKVIRSTGSWYVVKTEDGRQVDCRVKGKFRQDSIKSTNPVAVGDKVTIEDEEGHDTAIISAIHERDNFMSRQSPRHKHARHIIAANIDQAFLIVTVARPRTSTGFIDRFLVTAEAYHIPTHLIFNKQDALKDKQRKKQAQMVSIYEAIDYPTHLVAAITGKNIDGVKQSMKDKTTLLAGHSGVGKSTLINAIIPDLNLKTDQISKTTEKGKHITTYAEMHELPFGGYIIDTPGIKEFGVLDLAPEEVSHYFVEMRELLTQCKFNNCLHVSEPGCAVREALEQGRINTERYKNYLTILEDCKSRKAY